MRELTIIEADNGYILASEIEMETGIMATEFEVVEEVYDDNKTLKKLLMRVAEHMGYQYNKFGSENLEISFTGKGHKVD